MDFGRKKFDKLTFDFYSIHMEHIYITEIYVHSVTMIIYSGHCIVV